MLTGPTALAWATDPVAVAKAAVDYAKINDKFVVVGGALGARMLDADGIKALAELPSLDALRAQFLGLLNTPATRTARRAACAGVRGVCQKGRHGERAGGSRLAIPHTIRPHGLV